MTWPSTLVSYKRTATFTADSVPEGLLRAHDTKDGVWAMIRVLSGELLYHELDTGVSQTLGPRSPGFVEPGVRHRVEPVGEVEFYVEFFRAP